MAIPTARHTALRWTVRAVCTLAVLAGIVAMHGLPAATGSTAPAAMATTMTTPPSPPMRQAHPAHPADTAMPVLAQISTVPMTAMACRHDHCVATLRAAPQIATTPPVGSQAQSHVHSAPIPVLLELASERAPPQPVRLNVLCVSRT